MKGVLEDNEYKDKANLGEPRSTGSPHDPTNITNCPSYISNKVSGRLAWKRVFLEHIEKSQA